MPSQSRISTLEALQELEKHNSRRCRFESKTPAPELTTPFYTTSLTGPAPDPELPRRTSKHSSSFPDFSWDAELVYASARNSISSARISSLFLNSQFRYHNCNPEMEEFSGEAMVEIIRETIKTSRVLESFEEYRERLEDSHQAKDTEGIALIQQWKNFKFPEYKGDIQSYLLYLQIFEREKKNIWDDKMVRLAMLSTLPMKIMTFLIECDGRIPTDKEKFIKAIEKKARISETMLHSKGREHVRKYEEAKKQGRRLPSVWKRGHAAFKNVPHDEIRRYKKEGRKCFRCGRMSHRWFQCV
ncbi:hypothetical protein BZA77DRAFT_311641 [Pyronema omphalodes]|nr:hypothetical protein BZA77DRAFT_311641 [Pyronema omphalodes]